MGALAQVHCNTMFGNHESKPESNSGAFGSNEQQLSLHSAKRTAGGERGHIARLLGSDWQGADTVDYWNIANFCRVLRQKR